MRHSLSFAATLIMFWLLMSGHTSVLMLTLGLISVALVVFIVQRMDIIDHETHPVGVFGKLPRFAMWLFVDLILSNLAVLKHIWQIKPVISPAVLTYKLDLSGDIDKVIYANAITVTPGTITIDLQDDVITVHSLTDESSSNIRSGEKTARVRQLMN